MKQPKYITYKGAKYERIPTLNEIRVDPIPHRCCLIVVTLSGGISIDSCEFINKPAKKVAEDFLQDWKNKLDAEEIENNEFLSPSPEELDEYSYCGYLNEESSFAVCTQSRGAFSYIYDLAKAWDDAVDPDNAEDAYDALEDALANQINL